MVPMFGRYGVFFATGLTWFLNGTISLVRYKRGKWKKLNVISKISDELTIKRGDVFGKIN